MTATITSNFFLLEEQDRNLFENQRAYQGNKVITYTVKGSDGVDYLGIEGTTTSTVSVAVFIAQEPKALFSIDSTLRPMMEMQIEFFDDTQLKVGTTFEYENVSYYIYQRHKATTNRITARARSAAA